MIEKCDVFIPTYHRKGHLNNLLSSLVAIDKTRVGCVVVGITGQAEESKDYITDYLIEALRIQGIEVYVFDGSLGLLDTKQRFLNYGKEDVVLLVDDDMILTSGYLNLIYHFRDPKVGAVSGTYQSSINTHYKDWSATPVDNPKQENINKIVYRDGIIELVDKWQVVMLKKPQIYRCEALVGSAIFARRDLLEFDMKFQNGTIAFEEYDYTYNIRCKGYELLYDSSEVIFHNRGLEGGNRTLEGEERKLRKRENADYFVAKWKSPYRKVVVAVDFDGTIIEKLKFSTDVIKDFVIKDGVREQLKRIKDTGACLVLWTTRTGEDLEYAIDFCERNGLGFDYYNECPFRCFTRKLDADLYIDDKSSPDGEIDWNSFVNRIEELKLERK